MAARSMVAEPGCAICGRRTARLELIAPGDLPADWDQWKPGRRDTFERHYRDPSGWHLIYAGTAAGSGLGDTITADRAEKISTALAPPLSWPRVSGAGLDDDAGFCGECGRPYCYRHWNVTQGGLGRCPEGHEKILDPYY